jgi:cytochrome c556
MRSSLKYRVLGAALAMSVIGAAAAAAVDVEAVLKNRQDAMKGQAKNMEIIKGFLDGKSDQAAAQAAAQNLVDTTQKIPNLFPPGTDKASPGGKYGPKPAIWSDRSKFISTQKAAAGKSEALLAAVKTGDKPAIRTAFADFGKNGCGACHTAFREKLTP